MYFSVDGKRIGPDSPTYFIADIAANHDGDLDRALSLIKLAHEAGADAVKFQHHDCSKYVSDYGFKNLGSKMSHQTKWDKTIYEVYKDAEVPLQWTDVLKEYCNELGITFFTTPYDLDMVDKLDPHVPAFKIGSGDVAWEAMIEKVSRKAKPVFIATGAATMNEVFRAMEILDYHNLPGICLMQCNTNYTGDIENFKYINLNVLKTYKKYFPNVVLGLSDHTPGHVTVLGAVALGARAIEKHFTDDTTRSGPDHPFSMDPKAWREMVDQTRLLEQSLGSEKKEVQENEKETIVLQRRCIRVNKHINYRGIISEEDLEFQRPAPPGSLSPNLVHEVLGKSVMQSIDKGEHLTVDHLPRKNRC